MLAHFVGRSREKTLMLDGEINGATGRLEGRILLDTNVLIYATLEGDSRSALSRDLLLADGLPMERYISVQNLAEMYPNLTGPKTTPPDKPETARRKIGGAARSVRVPRNCRSRMSMDTAGLYTEFQAMCCRHPAR